MWSGANKDCRTDDDCELVAVAGCKAQSCEAVALAKGVMPQSKKTRDDLVALKCKPYWEAGCIGRAPPALASTCTKVYAPACSDGRCVAR